MLSLSIRQHRLVPTANAVRCRVGPTQSQNAREGMGQLISAVRCAEVSKPKSRIARHSDDDGTDKEQLAKLSLSKRRKHFGDRVFDSQIPRSVSIAESPLAHPLQ